MKNKALFPYIWCCLLECNEHEFCRGCVVRNETDPWFNDTVPAPERHFEGLSRCKQCMHRVGGICTRVGTSGDVGVCWMEPSEGEY